MTDKGREDCLGNCIYDRRDGLELEGRGEGRFSTDAHIKAIHGDYVVTPWCGKFMPALGGKLPIPGRKAMKPRFPTILPESFYYSGTILSLFGGGGRNRTRDLLSYRESDYLFPTALHRIICLTDCLHKLTSRPEPNQE